MRDEPDAPTMTSYSLMPQTPEGHMVSPAFLVALLAYLAAKGSSFVTRGTKTPRALD